MLCHDIEWDKRVAVNRDGAQAMSWTRLGLQSRFKTTNSSMIWHHCCFHKKTIAAKKLSKNKIKFYMILCK